MLFDLKQHIHSLISVILAAALTVMGGLLAGCGPEKVATSSRAERVTIAIQPSAAFIPLFVAKEKGWIEEDLKAKGITVRWNNFESGPPMNESLASGHSDTGSTILRSADCKKQTSGCPK